MELTPKIEELCRKASEEHDPKRLIELTIEINHLLDEQQQPETPLPARVEDKSKASHN